MERPKSWLKPADQLDILLDSLGLYRKHTARDSSCLFRAISEQMMLTQVHHTDIRRIILDYILHHKPYFEAKLKELGSSEDVESHVDKLRNQREWAGPLEIYALAKFFRVNITVRIDQLGEEFINLGNPRTIMLCLTHDKHYDPLYTKDFINNSAFCQALVYEVLYKKVFQLEEVDYAVGKMLHDKTAKLPRDDLAIYGNSLEEDRLELRDRCTDVKKLLDLGITPFPYKVAKALDLDIYRNVEFDVWNDYRKGLRYGLCSWNCKDLQIGAKCSIKCPEGKTYEGHVQEMKPNKGNVLVFVPDLAEKISVPYEWLEVIVPPPPPIPSPVKSWERPLSDLFGKFKEAASKKNYSDEAKPSPTTSAEYREERSEPEPAYEPYPYQNSGRVSHQDTVYPDSTKPGMEEAYADQPDEKSVNVLASRPTIPDGSDLPHTGDVTPVRYIYNIMPEPMRMNWTMRPCYMGVPYPHFPQPMETTMPDNRGGGLRNDDCEPEECQIQSTSFNKNSVNANTQAYEGAPLIQQYEVSSTTGGVMSHQVSATPLQPGPPQPQLYYPPVEVEGLPQYCPPTGQAVYLPEYTPSVYDFQPLYQPIPQPQYQYLPQEHFLYLSHPPQHP